jgi:hypothetical protein
MRYRGRTRGAPLQHSPTPTCALHVIAERVHTRERAKDFSPLQVIAGLSPDYAVGATLAVALSLAGYRRVIAGLCCRGEKSFAHPVALLTFARECGVATISRVAIDFVRTILACTVIPRAGADLQSVPTKEQTFRWWHGLQARASGNAYAGRAHARRAPTAFSNEKVAFPVEARATSPRQRKGQHGEGRPRGVPLQHYPMKL